MLSTPDLGRCEELQGARNMRPSSSSSSMEKDLWKVLVSVIVPRRSVVKIVKVKKMLRLNLPKVKLSEGH